ncbi:hypothetical protein F5050DRAFT_1803986 [Lentinula boryana]|uniref:Chromo domain-containing protein n=1 Tax=Lentinula boryana TaxID=40481 RepID=A0ABQ8QQ55_9AGAR|nr:hypothetical protein F5050DRAFT_1803986 [Lentinula boryana]
MGNRPKKKARIEEEEDSEEDVFRVEYFKAAKVNAAGEWVYLVKWHGYDDPKHDTWEPLENIANCRRLLASFWQEIGDDDEHYYSGYECTPSEAWINKERTRFARKNPVDSETKVAPQQAQATNSESGRDKAERRQKQNSFTSAAAIKNTIERTTSMQEMNRSSSKATKPRVDHRASVVLYRISKKEKSTQKPTLPAGTSSDSDVPIMSTIKKVEPAAIPDSSSDSDYPLLHRKRKQFNTKVATATGDPASLFTPEKIATRKRSGQSHDETEIETPKSLNSVPLVPSPLPPTATKRVSRKPSLPHLETAHSTPGPSTGRSPALPTLPKRKSAKPMTGSESVSIHSHLSQKPSFLHSISFKKTRGVPKVSSTITAEGVSPKIVPYHSPHDTPSPFFTTDLDVGAGLPLSLRQSQDLEVEAHTLPQGILTELPTISPRAETFTLSKTQSSDENKEAPHVAVDVEHSLIESATTNSSPDVQAEDFLHSVIPATEIGIISPLPESESPYISSQQKHAIWAGDIILETEEADEAQMIFIQGLLFPSKPGQILLQQSVNPLKIAMSYNKSKLIMKSRSFYGLEDLDSILAACSPAQAWGCLCAAEEQEMNKLRKVTELLSRQKWVSFVPVVVEGNVIGINLVFPSTLTHPRLPHVKPFVSNETVLIVSLHSWILEDDYALDRVQRYFVHRLDNAWNRKDLKLPPGMYEPYRDGKLGIKSLEGLTGPDPMFKHAVRMLEFPELLHSYLISGGERPFALWPPVDAIYLSTVPRIERQLLLALLEEYPATVNRGSANAEPDPSLRVIFVHVDSLSPDSGQRDIRDMPGLSDYRMMNDARFFAYGSSDIVNPGFPNIIEEIWPIGGIVTFTPDALLTDPLGVYERILQIEEHDFWVCYILPAVIGMAVSIVYRNREDVVQKRIACNAFRHTPNIDMDVDDGVDEACSCDGFAYEWLLDAINEEIISVVGAPPPRASNPYHGVAHRDVPRDDRLRRKEECKQLSDNLPVSSLSTTTLISSSSNFSVRDQQPTSTETQYNDPLASWIFELFDSDVRDRSETLAYCIKEFVRLCGNLPQEEWEGVIKQKVIQDLGRMQISKGFREEIRRFIVVTGKKDNDLQSNKGGFEWVTVDSFKFQDNSDLDIDL